MTARSRWLKMITSGTLSRYRPRCRRQCPHRPALGPACPVQRVVRPSWGRIVRASLGLNRGAGDGACRYLHQHQGSLFPVAIVGNKFIFTNTKAMAKIYAGALYNRNYGFGCKNKKSFVFGNETLTITPYKAPRGHLIDQLWVVSQSEPDLISLISDFLYGGRS